MQKGDRQVDRDFMREGEPLFDWEKVVIEKRRNMPEAQPSFDDVPAEIPAPPKNGEEDGAVTRRFRGLFGKPQDK